MCYKTPFSKKLYFDIYFKKLNQTLRVHIHDIQFLKNLQRATSELNLQLPNFRFVHDIHTYIENANISSIYKFHTQYYIYNICIF